ncbi:MAG: LuxR C-terminal-related transcriptional regulator [Gammaproteobacteria bacterium]|nr:LuxR C-terminal-related transcriptional regulator [Gammaproteobacteria bacterium]
MLKTRLSPPFEAGSLFSRARLLDLADQAAGHRLSIVQAPAGFGKTSLLSQWIQTLRDNGRPVGWVTIDSTGLDPVELLAYMAGALARALPSLAAPINALIDSRRHQTPDALMTALVNLLVDAHTPVILFLDDLHFLDDEAVAALARFLEMAPRQLSVITASRSHLNLGQGSLRARGQLLEIGMEQLRFTRDEIRDYLAASGWPLLEDGSLDWLATRTDGWITGIKLAGLALRNPGAADSLLRTYSGSHRAVSDFFAEQVLSVQSPEVQNFLLKSAVLDRFCAGLCDHVLEIRQSRRLLEEVAGAGLFLVALDDERQWYRYHPLFRDFLLRRLEEGGFEGQAALRLRAADWFREKEQLVEAIEAALAAGHPGRAAEILETCSQDWTYKGRIRLVTQFVERIPLPELQQYPTILLTWAWHLMRHLRFEEAQDLLSSVRRRVEDWENISTIPAVDLDQLRHQLLHREMTLAAARDDVLEVERKCQELLALSSQDLHPYLAGSVYAQLLHAQREQFVFDDVDSLAARARGVLQRSGYDFALIAALAVIGTSLFAMGKADAGVQTLEESIAVAVRYGGESSSLIALPGLPLAVILYERNQTERAAELLSRHSANATDWGMVDQFVAVTLTQARLAVFHGEPDEALSVLDDAMALALDRNLERLRLSVIHEQVRILSRAPGGTTGRILQLARNAGIPESRDEVLPRITRLGIDELRAMTWTRVALLDDRVADAAQVARNWRGFCEARGAQYAYVRWSILLAEALLLGEGSRIAQRVLREAMAVAAPMGAMRSFIDEGAPIRTLLEQCCQAESEASNPTDRFARKLLEAFGGLVPQTPRTDTEEGIYGGLTDRELEVLQQVSIGLRNREVAERLGMTEGSIKWYMQQIFDKLGTRSRLQAVERARRLGLIP